MPYLRGMVALIPLKINHPGLFSMDASWVHGLYLCCFNPCKLQTLDCDQLSLDGLMSIKQAGLKILAQLSSAAKFQTICIKKVSKGTMKYVCLTVIYAH